MQWFRAFCAAFFSTLLFHQGAWALLHLAGLQPAPPYNFSATPPLEVPAVLSLAFWGGLWGLPLWALIRRNRVWAMASVFALIFGAIFPSLVALAIVLPLKGKPFMAGWQPLVFLNAGLVNGAWGLGSCLLMFFTGARLAGDSGSR